LKSAPEICCNSSINPQEKIDLGSVHGRWWKVTIFFLNLASYFQKVKQKHSFKTNPDNLTFLPYIFTTFFFTHRQALIKFKLNLLKDFILLVLLQSIIVKNKHKKIEIYLKKKVDNKIQ
jgi:hypothetical protein